MLNLLLHTAILTAPRLGSTILNLEFQCKDYYADSGEKLLIRSLSPQTIASSSFNHMTNEVRFTRILPQ